MIIYATINSNKTDILISEYMKLRNSGVSADEILVLTQNSRKKKIFIEKIKKISDVGNIGNLQIYSFFGLARKTVLDFWPLAENLIKDKNAAIIPSLCGLEVPQYIFKNCIKEVEFKGYNSRVNLLHQLLRRYSLIVQNALSDNEIKIREKILNESYAQDVRAAIDLYKLNTLNYRAFDYLRQAAVFKYIYKNTKNPYKYVFVDDADEITPACFEYLSHIKPDIKEFFIAQDPLGSSRLGYLSAAHINFKKFLNEKALDMRPDNDKTRNAEKLFLDIKNKKPSQLENASIKSFIRRDEMLDSLNKKISELIKHGAKPSEIAIVTPLIDDFLRHSLKKLKYDVFFLSGSEKLKSNPTVGTIVEILKMINYKGLNALSPFILKGILLEILKLDNDTAVEITQRYREENYEYKKDILEFLSAEDNEQIQEFVSLTKEIQDKPLSLQLLTLCKRYIEQISANQSAILKLNKLAKQIADFEEVFKDSVSKTELIEQLENTIISENPLSEDEIPDNSIVAATAQKLIDNEICAKHLFLLDTSNPAWIKQDIGMLYNSWVFQKYWRKDSFELDDNLELTLDRTARILYKLFLCADKNIYLYSSIYDALGVENFGAVDKFFISNQISKNPPSKITPRDDQRAVLEYKSGKMAVSAVAGSGKTTIMLALIIKLLEGEVIKDLKSENIFVLTFMESAARNFRERIKQNFPDMADLPQISTIHGLALRILKENNNYTFIGLDNDFEIIDENKRLEILRKIVIEAGLEYDKTELYDRAISEFKNDGAQRLERIKSPTFKIIYKNYQKELLENNLVDYDDLLLYALKLLKTNTSVRSYYQNLARVVIEDEAQDSSPSQQELIKILSKKHGNIIRCGDVNQAITTTFSNSDVKGFKEFIKNSLNVEMNRSQRCAKNILTYANSIIDYSKDILPEAFLDIKMHPVKGKNDTVKGQVLLNTFDKDTDEKNYIIREIKKIKQNDPDSTVAILLRSNYAITLWADIVESHGFKAKKNFDLLSNNPVFRVVLAIFNFINNPCDKKQIEKSLKTLLELERYKDEDDILNFNQNNYFLSPDGAKYNLWWDLKYFLYKNSISPMELMLEISDFYFPQGFEQANSAMVYSLIEKINALHKSFEQTVERMNEISDKINKNIKFFQKEDEEKDTEAINIMTIHKAKGDEFDYVFIPQLSADNLGLRTDDIKLKKNSEFLQSVKSLPKTAEQLKIQIAEENYRLLYVGITRAKKNLYLTCPKRAKIYSKEKNVKVSEIFDIKEEKVEHI